MRRVHDALADYPGELPSYAERIEECAALLRRPDALPDVVADFPHADLRAAEQRTRDGGRLRTPPADQISAANDD
jgi:hypothetical protein